MKNRPSVSRCIRPFLLAVAGLALLLVPSTVFAASCPFCYSQAAASSSRFFQALRSGIIILMIPPAAMSIAFTVMAYRRRNTFHSTQ